jgi:hypothetical protein
MENHADDRRVLLMPSLEVEQESQTRIPGGGGAVGPTLEEEPPG